MANLFLRSLGGELLLPTVTWSNRDTVANEVTTVTTWKGKATRFSIRDDLERLKGWQTQDGVYKDHSLSEGGGEYDIITINFHQLNKSPTKLWDYNAPTQSFPLEMHPGYKAYWNHNIISTSGELEIDGTELSSWQAKTSPTLPTPRSDSTAWAKWSAATSGSSTIVDVDDEFSLNDWQRGEALKRGVNSFAAPVISVQETIYYYEPTTVTVGLATFTSSRVGSKEVAALSGRAGWPDKTFGLPKTVTDLKSSDYAEYRKSGYANGSTQSDFDAAWFTERGIPDDYPLWLCKSVKIKKVGNWMEATLVWMYSSYSVDADLYPLATARVNGLI